MPLRDMCMFNESESRGFGSLEQVVSWQSTIFNQLDILFYHHNFMQSSYEVLLTSSFGYKTFDLTNVFEMNQNASFLSFYQCFYKPYVKSELKTLHAAKLFIVGELNYN